MYSNCLCINPVVFPKGSFTNYVSQFFHIFDPPPSPPCQHMSELQRPPSSLMSENSYSSPTPFSEKFSKIRLTLIFSIYLHHTYTIFTLNSKKLINPFKYINAVHSNVMIISFHHHFIFQHWVTVLVHLLLAHFVLVCCRLLLCHLHLSVLYIFDDGSSLPLLLSDITCNVCF